MNVLFFVFFFVSLRPGTNWPLHCYVPHARCQHRVIVDYQQKIVGKCQDLSNQEGFVIDVLQQNVGESVYSISSCSGSTGYLASMLTEGAQVDNFGHPRSSSQPNIEHYVIMSQWITLQYSNVLNYYHRIKCFDTCKAFGCLLLPSSVWRHLWRSR